MKFSGNLKKTRRIIPYVLGVCLLAVLIPYFDSLRGDFVFDDVPLVQKDRFYAQEGNPLKCWERDFWKENMKQGLYRPFTLFSYWLNARIGGIHSSAFRIGNLIFHFFATILVFKLALRLRLGHWTAIFAAVLFAVHPIHTEAVIPAFGRGELLCALFLLCALIIHTHVEKNKLLCAAAGLSFLFACWSKEHGLAFLPLCVLLDLYLKKPFNPPEIRDFIKNRAPVYLLYVFAASVFFASRYFALGTLIPSKANFNPAIDNPIALCQFPLNVITALKVQGFALSQFFWPAVLSHDYSYAQLMPSVSVFDWKSWLTVILFLGIPGLICVSFKKLKFKMIFLLAAYAVCVMPAGNFIIMTGTVFGERLQYIPSIWLCMFSALVISMFFKKFGVKTVVAVSAAVIIAASARTYERGRDWDNQMSLATAGVRSAPNSVKTWNNLAIQLAEYAEKEKDPDARIDKYKEAVLACDRAISIYPKYLNAYANRGIYYSLLGYYDEAEKDLRKVISVYPKDTHVNYTIGALLADQGRLDEAKAIWEKLLKTNPDDQVLRKSYEKLCADIKEKQAGKEKSD
ncbi:MAG: tetratricopeptide repeat protein [Victivallales bacterium]|jgi:tetratricopeptide (TPR) repeat protein